MYTNVCGADTYRGWPYLGGLLAPNATTALHRDRPVLGSYDPLPEIQPLEFLGQIISTDLL